MREGTASDVVWCEAIVAVAVKSTVFWDVIPCNFIEVYQHFSEMSANFCCTTQCHIPENNTFKVMSGW
jgi:hypothetical protein